MCCARFKAHTQKLSGCQLYPHNVSDGLFSEGGVVPREPSKKVHFLKFRVNENRVNFALCRGGGGCGVSQRSTSTQRSASTSVPYKKPNKHPHASPPPSNRIHTHGQIIGEWSGGLRHTRVLLGLQVQALLVLQYTSRVGSDSQCCKAPRTCKC